MTCHACGTAISAEAQFCPSCGSPQEANSKRNDTPVLDGTELRVPAASVKTGRLLRGTGRYWLWGAAAVFVAFVLPVLFGTIARHPASAPQAADSSAPAAISVSGNIPSVQTIGLPLVTKVIVRNKGGAVDLVLDLGGCADHWVVDEVASSNGELSKTGLGQYYDFGQLPQGSAAHFKVTLVPKDAGNHECDVAFWNGLASDGMPNGVSPLDSVSANVAINP